MKCQYVGNNAMFLRVDSIELKLDCAAGSRSSQHLQN